MIVDGESSKRLECECLMTLASLAAVRTLKNLCLGMQAYAVVLMDQACMHAAKAN